MSPAAAGSVDAVTSPGVDSRGGWWSQLLRWLRGGAAPGGAAGSAGGATGLLDASGGRVRGAPPSGNGASSLHLAWELPGTFVEAAVTLEVLAPPRVAALYFWAFQASFTDGGRDGGGAHLGLQFHPSYPGSTAVNWGGYRAGGGELDGTVSTLRSTLGNPHTRDYRWEPGRAYRLRISRSDLAPTSWRGSVTDLATGTETVVRDLHTGGTALRGLMVWSEVFARCDDPSATVRWSDPVAVDVEGRMHRPATARVNYQSHADGGCANTTAGVDDVGLLQTTAMRRAVPQGATLTWPATPR